MASDTLKPEVIAFLYQYIESLGQLEILLLIQSTPDSSFTSDRVTQLLRSNSTYTEKSLNKFAQNGLVCFDSKSAAFSYAPKTPELKLLVNELAQEYRVRPLRVIEIITSRPTTQMMSFMDAFRLKRGDDHGND